MSPRSSGAFRRWSVRYFEPAAMVAMVAGIASLCQPWSLELHEDGLAVTLVGLVGFSVFSHVKLRPEDG